MASSSERRPYRGSCHCGFISYIVQLSLPPPRLPADATAITARPNIRVRKCNCTSCHKMGFFHVRLPDAASDFALLSPLDPLKELSDYTCFEGDIHWLFCPKCGVRCFAFCGDENVIEKEVPVWKSTAEGGIGAFDGEKTEMRKVWSPKGKTQDGWIEGSGFGNYLSVNATTLEGKQEGLDLREWTESKVVCYLDCLDETEDNRYERPHVGGCY